MDTALLINAMNLVADVAVVISLLSLVHSLRSYKLSALQEIDKVFEDNQKVLTSLYSFPADIICTSDQFPLLPPKRHRSRKYSEGQRRRLELREEQTEALGKLTEKQKDDAKQCIGILNNLMQQIEYGALPCDYLLSAHHIQLLRLIYILEPIRRNIEHIGGGNYGHRILRLQHQAYYYNQMHPKHRDVDVRIVMHNDEIIQKILIPASERGWFSNLCTSVNARLHYWYVKHFS